MDRHMTRLAASMINDRQREAHEFRRIATSPLPSGSRRGPVTAVARTLALTLASATASIRVSRQAR